MMLTRALQRGVRTALAPRQFAPAGFRAFGGHGDPRAHLNPDGTRPEAEDAEDYHDPDPIDHQPKLNLVKERGQTFVVSGDPPKTYSQLWEDIPQNNIPYWHRSRLLIWGNYKLLMKAEYLFFYIPTVLILGLVIPLFTTIYAAEEVVASTMTVKVTGRQWYWVYEVESPTDDGADDDE
mmetsp:Transcript_24633/g.82468  ORF Transcript_24633/g.82468 Transcript_24633/m.82468 type:complete len:179 (-) Transcript_24633:59-595(-)|eukprot:CAMPEP_0203963390 /NCGR_PEP_ID=MMETSP0359-20131031/93348_1 /ASSEMBLY_ACC=CAM_ASM_000338 /TAXON_ID=268821 /ORGANISM="Scrippsiella Hangoei, Strain SHTV-5" /LENGTH=178 /DNA_ID=CAMNT_0050899201 /DNA_START=63 /DNA_END=599 /DNA_ORIENTATION=+